MIGIRAESIGDFAFGRIVVVVDDDDDDVEVAGVRGWFSR
jgi:hypothetical protein